MISKSISVSKKLAQIAPFPALLFTWLIPHCDDGGNMAGDAFTVKALVVPARPETVKDVETAMEQIIEIGLVERYEVRGEVYIHITSWEEHQTLRLDRATWEYPPHPSAPLPNRQPSGNHPATKAGQTAAEGKVREGKVSNNNSAHAGFDAFWESFPRKVNKKGASKAWGRINWRNVDPTGLMLALEAHKASDQWTKDEGRFIPHPATWLNAERWNDEMKLGKSAVAGKFGAVKTTKV